MPSKSLAQNRFVHAKAAEGVPWAVKWVAEQAGHKVPHIQHVPKRKPKRRAKKRRTLDEVLRS